MALRDQPYLPLYVQDFMTDEKLIHCSSCATGVYIRIMCLMHKSDPYGKILLQQNQQQSEQQNMQQSEQQNMQHLLKFATQLARSLPYPPEEIAAGLIELVGKDVLRIEGNCMLQKRMVKDNEISIKRSKSGSEGGKKTKKNRDLLVGKTGANFATAKTAANSEYEYEYYNGLTNDDINTVIENEIKKYNMSEPGKKEFLFEVKGLGSFKIFAHDNGGYPKISEIEKFLLKNEPQFQTIANNRRFLSNQQAFQRVLQHFVYHIQEGAQDATYGAIQKHFPNWLNSLNGKLEKIINQRSEENITPIDHDAYINGGE